MSAPHPAFRNAISTLRDPSGAAATPPSAADLEARLAAVHSLTLPCLLDAVSGLIDHLAQAAAAIPDLSAEQRELTALWLGRAAERLAPVGEALGYARQATGAWTR